MEMHYAIIRVSWKLKILSKIPYESGLIMKLCRGTSCRMTKKKKKRSTIRKFSTVASSPAGAWLLADLHLCPQAQCPEATTQTWSHQAGCHQALPQMGLKAEIQRLAHPAANCPVLLSRSLGLQVSAGWGDNWSTLGLGRRWWQLSGSSDAWSAERLPAWFLLQERCQGKLSTRIQSSPGGLSGRLMIPGLGPAVTISRKVQEKQSFVA